MTKAERLARRMHELAMLFEWPYLREDYAAATWNDLQERTRRQYLYVARRLLRDQARERKEKAK